MPMPNVFDRLSKNLSSEQRRAMLSRIRESMAGAEAPLGTPEMEASPPSHEEQLSALGLWDRLRLWIIRLFGGRSREEVLDSWALKLIAIDIQRAAGVAIDMRNRVCKEECAREIGELQLLARRIDRYFEPVREDRAGVIAALVAQYLPEVQRALVDSISERSLEQLDLTSERSLRHRLTSILDEQLASIDPTVRSIVKEAVTLADRLARIAAFPFGAMIETFDGGVEEESRTCVLHYLTRPFERLSTLFVGMADPVDLRMIETLIVYSATEAEEASDESFQQMVSEAMQSFEEFESSLRRFVRRFPPIPLMRIIKEDPRWMPPPPDPTGDWIPSYRAMFVSRINELVLRTTLVREMTALVARLKQVCGETVHALAGLPDGSRGVMSRYWYTALVVETFSRFSLRGVLGPLKILLTNGEFYKSSNRAQFNDAYDAFERIPERLSEIEQRLRPDESWGTVLWTDPSIENRREIALRADEDLRSYLDTVRTTLEVLVNVLGGVLYARAGSPYDTIANYGQIGGRRNAEYIDELKEVHQRIGEILSCIVDADTIQKRAAENQIPLPSTKIVGTTG